MIFYAGKLPDVFLIPSRAWREPNELLNIIYIAGTFKNNDNKTLYAVINGDANKIAIITISTFAEDGQVNIQTFDNNGFKEEVTTTEDEIIQQSEKSKQELLDFIEKYNSGEISMNHTNDPDAVTALVSIPTNWEYWVCKFAGALACSMACVIFIELPPVLLACRWACGYFWSIGACS